jgi:hypothetical protein
MNKKEVTKQFSSTEKRNIAGRNNMGKNNLYPE